MVSKPCKDAPSMASSSSSNPSSTCCPSKEHEVIGIREVAALAPRFSSSSETPRLPAGQGAPSKRGGRAEAFGVSAFS
eukprot:9482880-Pyramimonas_sp.AAC.1